MHRRAFLKSFTGAGIVAASGGLATPAISQRAAARAVRLVPHADLANFDPIWTSSYIARNAGLLVWDTLYGVDANFKIQRQMVEAEEVSSDGLTWNFRLREGLKFHDGDPVTAKDAVVSINRWAARDTIGQSIKAVEQELVAVDDRSFRWVLRKPYPRMLLALGKISTPCCFIMPARIAATDPFKQINEYIGSGPMRFVRSDWVPGAKSVFERFADYVPRAEDASWMAGGKRIVADRIEWITMSDAATVAAALQNREVDWWELPLPDLVPMLRKNRNVVVDIQDRYGNIGVLALNHLFPPFNDPRARRAILMALNQEEYMRSYVGDDPAMRKPMPGYFTPGSLYYTEQGGEILKGPRNLDEARRLLAESGYNGEPIVCLAAQDLANHKAWGDVTADLLKQLGMTVDFAAVDWGTVVARRSQKNPPAKGGWHMYHTSVYGVDWIYPTSPFIQAAGLAAIDGWAKSPKVEAEIANWFAADNLEDERSAAGRINEAALNEVMCAPLGWYLRYYAWTKELAGVTQGPLPFFWGVSKTV
ncbi:ABC transporter substrate-binding protein [Bradyrhizobium erythrophlei]|uniref:Peptide/nickel transport system substrate-binding protein n=1 Tax=Bradyrhizobium erythrophlei TaxID=1437360 RepID=A0A1M7UFF4_9BRAD|nr:ABC transporter substrate-binding protein [Bradyrhizobium erythrophlei]SHN81656.1 peptide/nickel transport system substrate-binding protein [Bradyrhizobium erythrophlei]